MIKWDLSLGCKDGSTLKNNNVICHMERIKHESHIIISIDSGKKWQKLKPSCDKNFQQTRNTR